MPLSILEKVEIIDVAAEGNAIAKVDNLVIFVPFVAPGDIVDIKLTRKKNRYAEATALKIHHHGEYREEPFCEHFQTCGGCRWQHLKYEKQLHYKQKQVTDALERTGKIIAPPMLPIIASEQTTHYRNKLEFTFSDRRWILPHEPFDQTPEELSALGFHIPGRFDKVLDIKQCHLQPHLSNKIRNAVKHFCNQNRIDFQNLRTHRGLMRNLIIRNSNRGEWMVTVVFGVFDNHNADRRNKLLEFITQTFPEITSLWYVENPKPNDSINDLEPVLYSGQPYITEQLHGMQFQVGPKSFMQTNSTQAEKLYSAVNNLAQPSNNRTIYDLYSGTGTIAAILSPNCRKVTGVEYVAEATNAARNNAAINSIHNATFFSGDMKDILTQSFFDQNGAPDIIVTDPPRAGMHGKVIENILIAAPQKIIYVSCNPATQARDIALMQQQYKVEKIQPIDMFPHTHHVESIALLTKTDT